MSEDVLAPTDVPAFHKSAMDGYALAYESGRDEYIVDGIIGAGVVWDKPVTTGHAVRIMTGSITSWPDVRTRTRGIAYTEYIRYTLNQLKIVCTVEVISVPFGMTTGPCGTFFTTRG